MMWFNGMYQPAVNITTEPTERSASPLRRLGPINRAVSTHHCPNGEGFGLAAAKAVVTTTSVAGRACSRATPMLMAMRPATGSELLGEGPVALPAVTRSVPVESKRAPPEVTRSVPVESKRTPPEVTRSVHQGLRKLPGRDDL